jgi:hypothetical protein
MISKLHTNCKIVGLQPFISTFYPLTLLSGKDVATMARVQLRDLMQYAMRDIWGSLIFSLCSDGLLETKPSRRQEKSF